MQTRFHAYYIDDRRYCISYAYGNAFLLLGAHYGSDIRARIKKELDIMKISSISSIFIPQWTDEYCGDVNEFELMLNELLPTYLIIPNTESEIYSVYSSKIRQYQVNHGFAIVQYFNFSQPSNIIPQTNNNNVVFAYQHQIDNKPITVCFRFDTLGKWYCFHLPPKNLETNVLRSDIVVLLTKDSDIDLQLLKDCKSLNSNVFIRYMRYENDPWAKRIQKIVYSNKSYQITGRDAIVMRDSQGYATCYYYNHKTGLITGKQLYSV